MARQAERSFRNDPIRGMVAVGAVGPRRARLWARVPGPGDLLLRWWPEGRETAGVERRVQSPRDVTVDGTTSIAIPGSDELPPLEPRTRYRYRLVSESAEEPVGVGSFETAPIGVEDAPDHFSIAVISCHQPFDRRGRISHHANEMLTDAGEVLQRHATKLVLAMGDQAYSDYPQSLSLIHGPHFRKVAPPGRERLQDCTVAEVRRLYQARYRHFWNVPGWRALRADLPFYPILDDHEIVDNWGSDPAHRQPGWQRVGEGARLAYLDYQALALMERPPRLPEDFDYALDYGPLAVHVVDLRSNRRAGADERMLSEVQFERVERFLAEHRDRPVVGLVLSVPVVHMDRTIAKVIANLTPSGEDFSDRWSTAGHCDDRDRVLRMVRDHQRRTPGQQVLLLSGDIHIGCAHRLAWRDGTTPCYQIVSSGITHLPGPVVRVLADLSIRTNHGVAGLDGGLGIDVEPLRGQRGHRSNPLRGLNLGIVEFRREAGDRRRAPWRLSLHLYGRHGRCRFRADLGVASGPS